MVHSDEVGFLNPLFDLMFTLQTGKTQGHLGEKVCFVIGVSSHPQAEVYTPQCRHSANLKGRIQSVVRTPG